MLSDTPAISVRGIGKRYTIACANDQATTLGEAIARRVRRPLERAPNEHVWVLRDVSFDVAAGEVLGIVGRNGAGKSTLLKILARITHPTTGRARLRGRIGSLLEVGTGFHPELTGRENIHLNGGILGMRRQEIRRRFDSIVEFAEIGRFLDTPVKRYSSGMYLRLAFAVAAHLDPEILIVDEVLAVGDAAFQAKCIGKMRDVSQGGRTVLFVSHNLAAVASLCRRAILLDGGHLVEDGPTRDVLARYLEPAVSGRGAVELAGAGRDRGNACVTGIRLVGGTGETSDTFFTGDPMALRFDVTVRERQTGLQVAFVIRSSTGQNVLHIMSTDAAPRLSGEIGRHDVEARFPELALYPGRYTVDCVWLADDRGRELDCARDCLAFTVAPGGPHVARPLEPHAGVFHTVPEWRHRCAGPDDADCEPAQAAALPGGR